MEKKQKKSKMPLIILAVVALVMLLLLLTIIYFSLLKPQTPLLITDAITLQNPNPSPNPSPNHSQILQSHTLCINMSLQNPNRGTFYYANVGATMYYKEKQVGFEMIPGGDVKARSRLGFSVLLSVMEPAGMEIDGEEGMVPQMLTVTTNVAISGDVNVLGSFNHHTTISSTCLVSISTLSYQVITYNCG